MGKQYLNGVPYGVSKPYKELTLEEYEALPPEKNQNGVMYFIKNAGSAAGAKFFALSDIYDTNEREVGVWIDGKPVYQKTVYVENLITDSNWHTVAHGVADIDKVVDIGGATYHSENGGFWVSYALNSYRPTGSMGINISVTSNNIEYMNNWIAGHSAYITFKYTKTTDVAGSGTLGQGGIPAHHYDNTERVVGTYFGKPLYERSWIFQSEITINPSSWTSLGIPNTNIDLIVNAIGTSEWGISRIFSVSSKVDNTNLVALCTRSGNDSLKYLTLQYTKTTD